MPLTMRGTIMSFLAERLRALPEPRREQLGTMLLGLFRDSLGPRHDTRYGDYTPLPLPVPARHAAYSASLTVLTVLSAGEVTGRQLFPAARDPVEDWRKLALLWRSQLPLEGWAGLIGAIVPDRIWDNDQRDIRLHPQNVSRPPWSPDPRWSYNRRLGYEYKPRAPGHFSIWMDFDSWQVRDQARFLCDHRDDALVHALEPFAGDLDAMITSFHSYWPDPDRAVSAANALITLWLASSKDSAPDELAAAYDTCLKIVVQGFSPYDTETWERFRVMVLRQLAADQQRLPQAWLNSAVTIIQDATHADAPEGAALLRIANEALPELMAASPTRPAQQPGHNGSPGN
jgi:hypothetical protein